MAKMHSPVNADEQSNINDNFIKKIKEEFQKNKDIYQHHPDSSIIYHNQLNTMLVELRKSAKVDSLFALKLAHGTAVRQKFTEGEHTVQEVKKLHNTPSVNDSVAPGASSTAVRQKFTEGEHTVQEVKKLHNTPSVNDSVAPGTSSTTEEDNIKNKNQTLTYNIQYSPLSLKEYGYEIFSQFSLSEQKLSESPKLNNFNYDKNNTDLSFEYHFNQWSGNHSVKILAQPAKYINLLPSDSLTTSLLNRQISFLPGFHTKIIHFNEGGEEQRSRYQQYYSDNAEDE